MEGRAARLGVALGVGVVYFFAGKLGLAFAIVHANATAVWPPTGIALAAVLLLGRGIWPVIFAGGAAAFDRVQDIFKFVVAAALVSTTVSATIGVTTLALTGHARWVDFGPIWLTWWLGDAAGDLVVAPFLLLAFRGKPPGAVGARDRP